MKSAEKLTLSERYVAAFATVLGGYPWPPAPDTVIHFAARITDLCSTCAWMLEEHPDAGPSPIAVSELLQLANALLLVAANEVETTRVEKGRAA